MQALAAPVQPQCCMLKLTELVPATPSTPEPSVARPARLVSPSSAVEPELRCHRQQQCWSAGEVVSTAVKHSKHSWCCIVLLDQGGWLDVTAQFCLACVREQV